MNFTYDGDRDALEKELETEMKQYYMPMMNSHSWPVRTSQELDSGFTANFEHLNQFLRKYIVVKNYNTDFYKGRLASFQESRAPEDALEWLFGLKHQIYVSQRERLHLYFVEENGTFKMLSVTSRVQD